MSEESARIFKVALVSTTRAVMAPMEAAFRTEFPNAELVHLLDETILDDLRQAKGLSPQARRKGLAMVVTADASGVDGILVTCSSLSPAVEDFRPYASRPVVRIDEPAVERAVNACGLVGLLATADGVLNCVEPLVRAKAEELDRSVDVRRYVRDDIWPLVNKDPDRFYRAVGEAASRAARECPMVVITQVSMCPGWAYVDEDVRDRVLATPVMAVRALRALLEAN